MEQYDGYSKEVYEYLYLDSTSNREHCAAMTLRDSGIMPFKDGNQWCILVGEDIQSGICGFGELIYEALVDFLKATKGYEPEEKYGPFARQYKKYNK